jgi:AcrR family transcriptional regulator
MTSRRTDDSSSPARRARSAPRAASATSKEPRPRRARSGRRPGDSGTREQILEAALHLFADRGYARTTIRAIAEDAQVDPALVHHFFDNKEGVFDAAVNSPMSVSTVFDDTPPPESGALEGGPSADAAWLARTYLEFWENEETRAGMIAIYRTGLGDSANSETLRSRVEASIKSWAGRSGYRDLPDSETRAALASGHLAGLALMRYVLKIHPLADMEFEEFMGWVVPALEQRLSTTLEPRRTDTAAG